jgi:hypothetical protein
LPIDSATLRLYAWSRRTFHGMQTSVYEVNSDWDEMSTTWISATVGSQWGAAGCDNVPEDRQQDPVSTQFVYLTNRYYEWDITPLVQRWVQDPALNRGLIVVGEDSDQEIRFRSSDWILATQRPSLIVTN